MTVLIIEDENLPAQRLEKMLGELRPDAAVVARLQTIEESVEWFRGNPMPDLVFMDIHLADGSSFSIFDEVKITAPIVFTTAYDQYALKAFEVNSIDYLLKPIERSHLKRALDKLRTVAESTAGFADHSDVISRLASTLLHKAPIYKQSLLVTVKDALVPLAVRDVAYFYLDSKMVKAIRFDGKVNSLDCTLDELCRQLNPVDFFRANRQYVVARAAVKEMVHWFGSRLAVGLTVPTPERIFVSRTHVKEFKNWVTG